MELKMVIRAYDDMGKECSEGDKVLIQTRSMKNSMQEPAAATIIRIDVHILTVRFDDPLIARGEIMLKPSDIESIQYMKPARASYF